MIPDSCSVLDGSAVESMFTVAADSLQSVRVDNAPFPPHLHSGMFSVCLGAEGAQPATLGGSLPDGRNDRKRRNLLIQVFRQVRVEYDSMSGVIEPRFVSSCRSVPACRQSVMEFMKQ